MIRGLIHHYYPVQLFRPGGMVGAKYFNFERPGGNFSVENSLRIEGTVIITDAGVIAADDEMTCAPCSGGNKRVEPLRAGRHIACRSRSR